MALGSIATLHQLNLVKLIPEGARHAGEKISEKIVRLLTPVVEIGLVRRILIVNGGAVIQ